MSNLKNRVFTAAIIGLVVIGGIFLDPHAAIILFGLVNVLCLKEWNTLLNNKALKSSNFFHSSFFIILIGSLFYLLLIFKDILFPDIPFELILIPALFLLLLKELFINSGAPFHFMSLHILGLIWISLPLGLLIKSGHIEGAYNPWLILGILLLIWTNDIMAYFTGKNFGKTPLFKRVSPNKTWEGSLGGVVFCLILGALLAFYLPALDKSSWIIIALIAALMGGLGDLLESLLKRHFAVKDSGSLLPGHGGFLDRFDALLFAIPFVYWFLLLKSHLS